MKAFGKINPDSTPVVVLGCGHFYPAKALDAHMDMAEVYIIDSHGLFVGHRDISGSLARSVPWCPDCQRPI